MKIWDFPNTGLIKENEMELLLVILCICVITLSQLQQCALSLFQLKEEPTSKSRKLSLDDFFHGLYLDEFLTQKLTISCRPHRACKSIEIKEHGTFIYNLIFIIILHENQ